MICFVLIFSPALSQTGDSIRQSREYFGQHVVHEYTWLEEPGSERTSQWLEVQRLHLENEFSRADFKKFNRRLVFNDKPQERESASYKFTLKRYEDHPPVLLSRRLVGESVSLPIVKANDMRQSADDFPQIVNYWIAEGQNRLVAAISHSGSDWIELAVFDIQEREYLYSLQGTTMPWILMHDNGFIYLQFEVPGADDKNLRINQRLSFHAFNTPQKEDRIMFQNTDKTHQRTFEFTVSEDKQKIILFHPFKLNGEWREAISVLDVANPLTPDNLLVFKSDVRLHIDFVCYAGDEYYFRTNLIGPTYGIVKVSADQPGKFDTFLPGYQEVLLDAVLLGDGLIGLKYLDKGTFIGKVITMDQETRAYIPAPVGVTLDFLEEAGDIYVQLEGFYHNPSRIRLVVTDEGVAFNSSVSGLYPEDIQVEITSYPNGEGDQVPAYLVYNRNKTKRKGENPAMVQVYGGYGYVVEPQFSWENYYFVRNGGVLLIPAVRGSGALGAAWAEAGAGVNKQNTIDDIIGAAEFLISEQYTNPDLLLLKGSSHGGFAVSAAAIQRPDLFKGVISRAAPLDLVRITDETTGNNLVNRIEYGDPEREVSFKTRMALSPIHNLEANVDYPSFLLITGRYDTRVSPAHSYRFMEALSASSTNERNYLYVTNGGHGITNNPEEELELISLELKFMYILTGTKFWL